MTADEALKALEKRLTILIRRAERERTSIPDRGASRYMSGSIAGLKKARHEAYALGVALGSAGTDD